MLICMNLGEDLDRILMAELADVGHHGEHDERPINRYCLWYEMQERLVPQQAYTVVVSTQLKANPKYRALKAELGEVITALKTGESLTPYLSSRIFKPGRKGRDHMQLHWNIKHLHLSPLKTLKPGGFVERADNILFFRIKEATAYLIDILPHDELDLFEQKSILEIVERNWPYLHKEIRGVLAGDELSAQDRHQLRRANLTHFESIDGRVIMPTSGVSSAGSSTEASLSFDRHGKELRSIEANIRARFLEYFPKSADRGLAHVRLTAMWERGFDVFEMFTSQAIRFDFTPST